LISKVNDLPEKHRKRLVREFTQHKIYYFVKVRAIPVDIVLENEKRAAGTQPLSWIYD
jgi:hypothetical protein